MNTKFVKLVLLFSLLGGGLVRSQLTLPHILTSHMVLQQEKPVSVWGKATPGLTVRVQFAGQEKSVIAASDSSWKLWLDPMPASFEARSMRILTPVSDTVLSDILVGEVWLCGGQSNMEYPMDRTLKRYAPPARGNDLAAEEWRKGGNTAVRLIQIEKINSLPDCTTTGWQVCSDSVLASFSAIGYYFGNTLQQFLHVPVGLIGSYWGGSRIERWTPASAYEQSPLFAREAAAKPVMIDGIDAGLHYNSMIGPLAPYTLRGFIWYQGESNVMINDARYAEKTKLMLNAWRNAFENEQAPFYYVQVAPYLYTARKDKVAHTPQTLPEFWAQQTACMALPGTGQVVVTDLVDNLKDIHPPYKWEVGRRLALWALKNTYHSYNGEYTGPLFQSARRRGDRLELTFIHTGTGLTAGWHDSTDNRFIPVSDARLEWFEVAGNDGVFYPAEARVHHNKVVVYSTAVSQPVMVRFAWNERAMPNFFNSEGLPAVPFTVSF